MMALDLYFSAPIQLLIVLRQFTSIDARYISPFQQSYPSHIPLGACYGTDDLFGSLSYASPYLAVSSTCIAAWTVFLYFAGSSDRNGHTHHGYFMDHRHISWLHESTFCRLYRASDTDLFASSAPVGVSVWAFQGVTLSFHLLEYQFYEAACKFLSTLRKLASCLTFSVRNVSHPVPSHYREKRSGGTSPWT